MNPQGHSFLRNSVYKDGKATFTDMPRELDPEPRGKILSLVSQIGHHCIVTIEGEAEEQLIHSRDLNPK